MELAASVLCIFALYGLRFLFVMGHRRVVVRASEIVTNCSGCGYSLAGLHEHPSCPECGLANAEVREFTRHEWRLEPERLVLFAVCVGAAAFAGLMCNRVWAWFYRVLDGRDLSLVDHGAVFQSTDAQQAVSVVIVLALVPFWHLCMPPLDIVTVRKVAAAFVMAALFGTFAGLCSAWQSDMICWSIGTVLQGFAMAYAILAFVTVLQVVEARK